MLYLSAAETAKRWGVSERSVRHYCQGGRVPGAYLVGKTWNIPDGTEKPLRRHHTSSCVARPLADRLIEEREANRHSGLYATLLPLLAYHHNHAAGSRLTLSQTKHLFEHGEIGGEGGGATHRDICMATNHFRIMGYLLDHLDTPPTPVFLKQLYALWTWGLGETPDEILSHGGYRKEVLEGREAPPPSEIHAALDAVFEWYRKTPSKTGELLLELVVRLRKIQPYPQNNSILAEFLLWKESLRFGLLPFIIEEDIASLYERGFDKWEKDHAYLLNIVSTATERLQQLLIYYHVPTASASEPS